MAKYEDRYTYGRPQMSGMSEKGGSCLPSGHKVIKVEKMGDRLEPYCSDVPAMQKKALKEQESYIKKNMSNHS